MKKLFIKSLMTVGVVGLVGLTSAAMAAEANWYGSIRAGLVSGDDGALDIGATNKDGKQAGNGLWTRIGVQGSVDLGNGQSAGGQIEIGLGNAFTADDLDARHHNVWIGGGWGKLTFGQQNNPYRSAANWDQAWMLGGQVRRGDGGTRLEGIKYSSNIDGPFSFDLTVTGNDTKGENIDRFIATAHYNFGVATLNVGINQNKADSVLTVGAVVASADTMTGTITPAVDEVASVSSYDNSVISVNGSTGGLGWNLAYEKSKANGAVATDASTLGLFLSYALGDSDKIYLEHEAEDVKVGDGRKATLFGYSHSLGDGVTFIAEHSTVDSATKAKVLNLVLKYDF